MNALKKGLPVEIEWLDAHNPRITKWMNRRMIRRYMNTPLKFRNVGIVLGIKKKMLFLCGAMNRKNDSYQAVFAIPIGCIKKVRVLK